MIVHRHRKLASGLLAILLVSSFTAGSAKPASGTEEARRADWVQKHAQDLDVQRLAQSVASARIVAIGESTHGTSEFQQFRSELSKELIARHGFDTIVIEATEAGTSPLNAYVQGRNDQVRPALAETFYWIWQNDEFARIFADLRVLNATLSAERQTSAFAIRGMDVFPRGATTARLKSVLLRHRGELVPTLEGLHRAVFSSVGPQERKVAVAAIRTFLADLTSEQATRNIDAQARDELTRSAADLSSFYLYFASEIPDQEVRDRAMADNVRQLVDSGHRVIVWVHNGHVANAPGSFGGFLRKRYGKDYVPVGLTTFSGTYSGLEPGTNLVGEYKLYPSPEQSLEAYLQKTGHVTAYVDLRTTKGRAVPQWLGTPLPCRPDIGFFRQPEAQSSDVCTYKSKFDLMVFFSQTKGTAPFPIWPNGVPLGD